MPDPNALIPLLFLAAIVGGPIALVLLVVLWRSNRRRAWLRGPWTTLAQKLGGQFHEGAGFAGSSVQAQRPTHALTVRMRLVAAMEVRLTSSYREFYGDGGTFTEVLTTFPPQSPAVFTSGQKVLSFRDHARVPALSQVAPDARIFLEPKTARIVLPGVVYDLRVLHAAVQSVEELTRIVLMHGPMQHLAAAAA